MIIDSEEHRAILRVAVENMPISGPAGAPEMLRQVTLVHQVLAAIDAAEVGDGREGERAMLDNR